MAERLLSREEAAERLAVSTRTVDRLIEQGKLRAARIGRRVVIKESELQRYIDALDGEQGE